jgi:hypothetical protein
MKRLLVACLSLVALSATANAQTATREDFQELCGLIEGHWTAEITNPVDLPGFFKKGEKQTVHYEVKRDAGGHLLIGRFYTGSAVAVVTIAYSPADKKIATLWVGSDGSYATGSYYKKGTTWTEQGIAILTDGAKYENLSTMKFSDDNTKLQMTGSTKIGGKSVTDRNDTYTRVGK